MRLAAICGRADVDQLLQELTPQQFAEWRAFDRVEGVGIWRLVQAVCRVGCAVSFGKVSEAVFYDLIPQDEDEATDDDVRTVAPNAMAKVLRAYAGGAE